MIIHNNTYVLSGGSSVSKGYWTAIDFPQENRQGYWIPELRNISKLFADYLLASGQVDRGFGYLKYKDLIVVQSRLHKYDPPQEHHFFSSLLTFFGQNPGEVLMIKTPFDRETSISIRRRIQDYLEGIGVELKDNFLQFIPKEAK